jgi:hypothetical protein
MIICITELLVSQLLESSSTTETMEVWNESFSGE